MVEFGTMSSPAMLNCLTCKQPFMSLEHYQSLQFWNLAKMVEGLCEAGWWCWSLLHWSPLHHSPHLTLTLAWDSGWGWCWSWWTWDCTDHSCYCCSCCCCSQLSSCLLVIRSSGWMMMIPGVLMTMSDLMLYCWHCSTVPQSLTQPVMILVYSIHWLHHSSILLQRTAADSPAPGSCPASVSARDPSDTPWTRPPPGRGSSGSHTSDCCQPLKQSKISILKSEDDRNIYDGVK